MPPTRQNEEVEHTPNGTQKRPRNANKQWATDIDDNGVSAEMHVAKWLVSINQNERLANYHRWTIGNEKKDYLANQCHQYLIEKGCDSRRQVKGVFLKINHIVEAFNKASMLGTGIGGNAEEANGPNLLSQRNKICPFYEILAPVIVNRPFMAEHSSHSTLHRSLDLPEPDHAALQARIQRLNEDPEDKLFDNDADGDDDDDQGAVNVNIRDNGPWRQGGHVEDADWETDDGLDAADDRLNELARQQERNDDRRHLQKLAMRKKEHVDVMTYKEKKLAFAHRELELQERKAKSRERVIEIQERKVKAKERMVEIQEYEAKMKRWYNKMDLLIKSGRKWEEACDMTGPEPEIPIFLQ
ncbi:hypothetical protein C348_02717 [Cryptococcus neoformans Gb118]|nr:hypothetical protein C350_02483 [Cryptococcus neoformans var. grubii MW-RSA36]OXL08619.1 hypothetical protein C348_02717 [Cryptococcus neoformans var. grubii Gb118]